MMLNHQGADQDITANLLEWYDVNARILPWRVSPQLRSEGVLPNPYHVWLSEIMLQQTTVVAVKAYFEKFTSLWPEVHDLAKAPDEEVMAAWAGLGYYARARNLLKTARIISQDYNGVFPSDPDVLIKLPGVGPYTAAAVGAIAFDISATVLDGNVERVMARQHGVKQPLPDSKEKLRSLAAKRTPQNRAGDYAQAVMDLGATVCTPRNPSCGICPWQQSCVGYNEGIATELPKKRRKAKLETRQGVVYVGMQSDGAVLLERRPKTGLLGGMLGWPGSAWGADAPLAEAPIDASWDELSEKVRHTFTHFHLQLSVKVARINTQAIPTKGCFVHKDEFDANSLPTVMRKVWAIAQPALKRM